MAAMIGAIFIKFGRAPTTFRIFTIAEPPLSRFCDYPRERQRDYGTDEQTETTRETFRPFRFFWCVPKSLGRFPEYLHFLKKAELIAPHPAAAAFQFGQRDPALAVKVENLFGRCDLVRITADPIHDVSPTGHAAKVVRLDPRAQVFAGTAVQRGA